MRREQRGKLQVPVRALKIKGGLAQGEAGVLKIKDGSLKGEVGTFKMEVRLSQMEARSLKREARSLKMEVGTLKGELRSLKRELGLLKIQIPSLKMEVGTLKMEVGSLQILRAKPLWWLAKAGLVCYQHRMAETNTISTTQFKQVLEVSRLLTVTTELDSLLAEIARHCCTMLACERASIFLYDPEADELWTKIALGSKEIRVPAAAGIAGFVFKSNHLFHCRKPYEDPRFNPEPDKRSGFVTRNLLTAPMVDLKRNPVGVIQAVNKISPGGFTEADESLIQLLADQSGVAVQRYHLQEAALEGVALRREMDLAKIVQEALVPKEPPTVRGLRSVGWTLSASITGGDSYDLWKLSDGRLGVFVGDASGHGIAPALVVSQARTLVRAMCEMNPDPHVLLTRTNARLAEDLVPGRFVTAFLGILDNDGLLRWSSAGHGPVLLRRTREGPIETLEPPGPPLGIMGEFMADPVEPIQMESGGMLLVMSDGIFEAFAPDRQQFGVEAVHEIVNANPRATPGQILETVRTSVQKWQGKTEPADDQTMVIAQVE